MAEAKDSTPAKAPASRPAKANEPYRVEDASLRSERVRVRDKKSGEILPDRVPRTWLNRFPQLVEVPSEKEGK